MALEALERSDIKRLPGGIFTRAFVRAYAAEVGLDPEQAVQDFLAQFSHDPVSAWGPGRPIEDNEAIESDRRMAQTVIRLILFSLPIAGLIIYFGT
jgi:cytoskeletal protein RodZ